MNEHETGKQRLDKWLFFARFLKSRSLAATFISGSKVRVNNSKINKPAQLIKIGDQLTFLFQNQSFTCRVLNLSLRRGSALEAQTLYEDLTPRLLPVDKIFEATVIPGTKPNKRERRKAFAFISSLN